MVGGAAIGDDGIPRCPWSTTTAEYRRYHDREWGRPLGDENRVFEKLCLEGFQGGLSWLTILRKREAFRRAFAFFDPAAVAGFEEEDVRRLLADAAIVRNRAKIEATIANARATVRLREQGTNLAALLWRHEPRGPSVPPRATGDLPALTAESRALSAELRRHGFSFVGPTTVYAAMQALGVVNDHLEDCRFRAVALEERARFEPPV
ncbi:MAG TPA: DNA-3-methyladenine glycosylase I [Candidatus Binatia bacterium]|nr:DNA-3-methyladenine glycosylase I [Candidatus Binatia bacterium]